MVTFEKAFKNEMVWHCVPLRSISIFNGYDCKLFELYPMEEARSRKCHDHCASDQLA